MDAHRQLPRMVFVTGGVASSLGKGVAAASIGRLFLDRGLRVRLMKLDPYLSQDAGLLAPEEHGEVFVTSTGFETDLDLGTYERFISDDLTRGSSVTAGQVLWSVLTKERHGDYLGKTVQVIPHVTDEIERRAFEAARGEPEIDLLVVEVGGTVGDIEIRPFLESVRRLRGTLGTGRSALVHLTLLPSVGPNEELKTKPTQHSVAELRGYGLMPDVLLARCRTPLDDRLRRKLSLTCGLPIHHVMSAHDVSSIYAIPANFAEQGLDTVLAETLTLSVQRRSLTWQRAVEPLVAPSGPIVRVGICAKYLEGHDTYLSVTEALSHAAGALGCRLEVAWRASDDEQTPSAAFGDVDAIVVPGGFGTRGIEGKIAAAGYAREHGVPFLGLCLGLHVAVVDAARNLGGIADATSAEWSDTGRFVIDLLESQRALADLGGTMRLGNYPAELRPGTRVFETYAACGEGPVVLERHRHRYEVDRSVLADLEQDGFVASGCSPDGLLVEFVEYSDHPYFVATQAHPEYRSRPDAPHPLFTGLVRAGLERTVARRASVLSAALGLPTGTEE